MGVQYSEREGRKTPGVVASLLGVVVAAKQSEQPQVVQTYA